MTTVELPQDFQEYAARVANYVERYNALEDALVTYRQAGVPDADQLARLSEQQVELERERVSIKALPDHAAYEARQQQLVERKRELTESTYDLRRKVEQHTDRSYHWDGPPNLISDTVRRLRRRGPAKKMDAIQKQIDAVAGELREHHSLLAQPGPYKHSQHVEYRPPWDKRVPSLPMGPEPAHTPSRRPLLGELTAAQQRVVESERDHDRSVADSEQATREWREGPGRFGSVG